jgi:hypothetical protein
VLGLGLRVIKLLLQTLVIINYFVSYFVIDLLNYTSIVPGSVTTNDGTFGKSMVLLNGVSINISGGNKETMKKLHQVKISFREPLNTKQEC